MALLFFLFRDRYTYLLYIYNIYIWLYIDIHQVYAHSVHRWLSHQCCTPIMLLKSAYTISRPWHIHPSYNCHYAPLWITVIILQWLHLLYTAMIILHPNYPQYCTFMGFPSYSNEIPSLCPQRVSRTWRITHQPINSVRIEKLGEEMAAGSLIKPQQKSPRFDG